MGDDQWWPMVADGVWSKIDILLATPYIDHISSP
jgi:hypothetical protein